MILNGHRVFQNVDLYLDRFLLLNLFLLRIKKHAMDIRWRRILKVDDSRSYKSMFCCRFIFLQNSTVIFSFL
jgi:hypothetical protein